MKGARLSAVERDPQSAPGFPPVASRAPQDLPDAWEPTTAARSWRYIVFHHSATAGGDVEAIDAAHRRRTDEHGQHWRGIGYHFLIGNGQGMPDGLVEPTFRWREQVAGAHAGDREHNDFGIGVCLVGDFEHQPPTERQVDAAKRLVDALTQRFAIERDDVVGHGALKDTACPGRKFPLAAVAGISSADSAARRAAPLLELPARLPAGARR